MPDIIDLEVSRRKVLIGGAGGAAMGALPAEAQTTPEAPPPAPAAAGSVVSVQMEVNGEPVSLQLDTRTTLLDALREHLRLTGRARGAPDSQALGDEAADVLGMLLIYCARSGVDLEQAMRRKWLKWLEPHEGDAA